MFNVDIACEVVVINDIFTECLPDELMVTNSFQ